MEIYLKRTKQINAEKNKTASRTPEWKQNPSEEIVRRPVEGVSLLERKISKYDRQQWRKNRGNIKKNNDCKTSQEPSAGLGAEDISLTSRAPKLLSKKTLKTYLPKLGTSITFAGKRRDSDQVLSTSRDVESGTRKPRSNSLVSETRLLSCARVISRPNTSHYCQRVKTADLGNETPDSLTDRPRSPVSICTDHSSVIMEETTISGDNEESLPSPRQETENTEAYDTDCEPDITSDFRKLEYKQTRSLQDYDVCHFNYEDACEDNGVRPRARVRKQLWQSTFLMRHGGLKPLEHNARVEEVDMSYNAMQGQGLNYLFSMLKRNNIITSLILTGNVIDTVGATACCSMMTHNNWLLKLNLSDCGISDNEVACLAQGLRVNEGLQRLNLSKNKIGITGGLQLGRALCENSSLVSLCLSWNFIRSSGAVAICNSLQQNSKLEELDLSWNGIGFEGCLALGESLKLNSSLKALNLENNRINWDAAPYLAKGLGANRCLQSLEIGQNPLSMDGCSELLTAIAKPACSVKFVSFAGIPINTQIALMATDIAQDRDFSLEHGGILSSRDVIGIQRTCREDPLTLLVRFLSLMGIRVVDLFRMFDKDNNFIVTRQKFIQGLKKARVPLEDADLLAVAKRLQSNKLGHISYQELAKTVRNRIREERKQERRQLLLQKKKEEERSRILQSDRPVGVASLDSNLTCLPSIASHADLSPIQGNFSRRNPDVKPLPHLPRDRTIHLVSSVCVQHVTQSELPLLPKTLSSHSFSQLPQPGKKTEAEGHGHKSEGSYVSQMRWQCTKDLETRPGFM